MTLELLNGIKIIISSSSSSITLGGIADILEFASWHFILCIDV